MKLEQLEQNWNELGKDDPYWAVLTDPNKKNNQWTDKDFFETGDRHFNNILKTLHAENVTGKNRALDFGCGPGRISQAMCRHFTTVVGVDISNAMIEKAKSVNKFPQKCTYQVNTKNDLSAFEDASFDLVFSYITLQHINPKYSIPYIKEFTRIVKPQGHIIFNLPTQPPFYYNLIINTIGHRGLNLLRKIYFRKKWVMEMHWVKEANIRQLMQEQNCEIITTTADKGVGEKWQSNFYLIRKY